jgi:hypothetical protein
VETLARREVQAFEAVEIQAVVHVPAIGGAAPFRDERLVPQPAEMVGDEVVRLAHESHQLLDPAVTPGHKTNPSSRSCTCRDNRRILLWTHSS